MTNKTDVYALIDEISELEKYLDIQNREMRERQVNAFANNKHDLANHTGEMRDVFKSILKELENIRESLPIVSFKEDPRLADIRESVKELSDRCRSSIDAALLKDSSAELFRRIINKYMN